MKTGRSSFASCVVKRGIYVAGGMTYPTSTSEVEHYCTTTDECTRLGMLMRKARTSFGLVFVNNKLYAVGGDDCGSVIYKDESGSWHSVSINLPTGLGSYDVFSLGGEIYVLGKTKTGEVKFLKFRPTDSRPTWYNILHLPLGPWEGGVRVALIKNQPCENDKNARLIPPATEKIMLAVVDMN